MKTTKVPFLLFVFAIISISAWSQVGKPDYAALRRIMLSGDFDRADSMLRSYGFQFQQPLQSNTGGECLNIYTWKKFNLGKNGGPDYNELLALYRKCEGEVWYNMLRYLTFDEGWFNELKSQGRREAGLKDLGEEVNKQCVIRKYKDKNFILHFKNCYNNRQEYHLDIVYDFPY